MAKGIQFYPPGHPLWKPALPRRSISILAAACATPTIRSVTVGTNTGASATVSATTPSDTAIGDLLVIFHGNDFYALSNMPTPTCTGSPTLDPIPDGIADAGTNLAHVKSYTAVANTAGANTVTVTETGAADEEKEMVVYVLTGADTSSPVDDAANNFETGSTTSQESQAVIPISSNALLITHNNSGGGGSSPGYTSPASMTEQYDNQFGGFSSVGATEVLTASGDTGQRVFTAASACPYGTVTVAIKCAAGVAPVAKIAQFNSQYGSYF